MLAIGKKGCMVRMVTGRHGVWQFPLEYHQESHAQARGVPWTPSTEHARTKIIFIPHFFTRFSKKNKKYKIHSCKLV